jgi:hypothetical protein
MPDLAFSPLYPRSNKPIISVRRLIVVVRALWAGGGVPPCADCWGIRGLVRVSRIIWATC